MSEALVTLLAVLLGGVLSIWAGVQAEHRARRRGLRQAMFLLDEELKEIAWSIEVAIEDHHWWPLPGYELPDLRWRDYAPALTDVSHEHWSTLSAAYQSVRDLNAELTQGLHHDDEPPDFDVEADRKLRQVWSAVREARIVTGVVTGSVMGLGIIDPAATLANAGRYAARSLFPSSDQSDDGPILPGFYRLAADLDACRIEVTEPPDGWERSDVQLASGMRVTVLEDVEDSSVLVATAAKSADDGFREFIGELFIASPFEPAGQVLLLDRTAARGVLEEEGRASNRGDWI